MAFKDLHRKAKEREREGEGFPKSAAEIRQDGMDRGAWTGYGWVDFTRTTPEKKNIPTPAPYRPEESSVPAPASTSEGMEELKQEQFKMKHAADAKWMAQESRREYEAYVKSGEYITKTHERERKQAADKVLYGIVAPLPDEVDEKERQLKATADYWQAQAEKEENQRITDDNMAKLDAMPPEDQAAIRQYAMEKNAEYGKNLGMPDGFLMGRADQKAAPLIEKYGMDTVERLAETWMREQNRMGSEKVAREAQEAAGSSVGAAVGHSAASVGANLVGGLTGVLGYIQELSQRTGQYKTLDPNNGGTLLNTYAGAVREQVGQDLENSQAVRDMGAAVRAGLINAQAYATTGVVDESFIQNVEAERNEDNSWAGKAASLGYQGIMSAADSLARMAVTGGNAGAAMALAGAGSFAQTVSEASAQGATPGQAAFLGLVSACLEGATEYLPIENLLDIAKGGAKPAAKVLMQVLSEITEEEAGLLGNYLAEAAVLQGKSGYQQQIGEAVANGVPYAEAVAMANKGILKEAAETALVSGISGGISGGLTAVTNKVVEKATGKPLIQEKQEQAEQEKAYDRVMEVSTPQPQQEAAQKPQEAAQAPETPAPVQTPVQEQAPVQEAVEGAAPSAQQVDTSRQSAVGEQPGIKGTGAAEGNFSQKPAYNATLSEDNAQPDRADDVRPMELPQTDINGGRVSAVTGNVYGSKATPDELASLMEEPTARGRYSYIQISNEQATQRAADNIAKSGTWDEAFNQWIEDITKGIAGAEMTARGALFLNKAANAFTAAEQAGDVDTQNACKKKWLSVLSYMQKLGTNTAQGLQAFQIIRELNPPDKIDFVGMMIREMAKDLKTEIVADEALLNKYREAKTDAERDAIMEDIQQNIADQIPSTVLDKWNALRYTNMLGNLKTVARNVGGNVANSIAYRVKDTTAAAVEGICSLMSGGKFQKSKSLTVSKELRKACAADFNAQKELVNSGGKFGDRMSTPSQFKQGVMDKRRIFKVNDPKGIVGKAANAAMAPMEWYRKGTNWAMNNGVFGDEAFGRAAYSRSMAGYLKANGVKGGDLSKVDSKLLNQARAYAVQQAQEVTFHDNSTLANIMGKGKKAFGVLGEGIMPFTKTPANVLTRAAEFSPLGVVNSTVKTLQKAAGNTGLADQNNALGRWAARGQDISGADIIDAWAKTFTGAALAALGAALWDQGLLTGGPDEDENKEAFDQLNGQQNYAIQLPDGTSYTLDWVTPAIMPVVMGAQLMRLVRESESGADLNFSDLEEVFTSIADPMIQMSMLQGINDSLDNIKYSDDNLMQFAANAALSYLTQGLTNTLLGQMERSTEGERMTTYVDKDSAMPAWMQRALGKASAKTPGWDFQQTPYINAKGETEKQDTGPMGWIYNLVSPGYISKTEIDETAKELYRLNEAGVTDANVFPTSPETTISYEDKNGDAHKDYNLSSEEADQLKRVTGQESMQILGEAIKNPDYDALTDAQKAKVIEYVYNYAREKGRGAAIPDYKREDDWRSQVKQGSEAQTIIQRVVGASLTGALSEVGNAWKEGWSVDQYKQNVENAYETYRSLSREAKAAVKKNLEGNAAKYIAAREGLVEHDKAVAAIKNASTVKGSGPYNAETHRRTVKDVDRWGAIAATAGLSNTEKDFMMKLYMDDGSSTEKKYDYLRGEGYTPSEFTAFYRIYLEEDKRGGEGTADRTKKRLDQETKLTKEEAEFIYKIFGGSEKPWEKK